MVAVEVFFPDINEAFSEVIVAELSLAGYDQFWMDDEGLRAYIEEDRLDEDFLKEVLKQYDDFASFTYEIQRIKPNEWDRVKEKFEPFVVAERITIVVEENTLKSNTPYEIIMDAQMSFGSGKHPSTVVCLEAILDLDFKGKTVIDAGTGSGILAIMASKLGAKSVVAFDNNPWAIDVATYFFEANNCSGISVVVGDIDGQLNRKIDFDIVLANLNFEVLTTELEKLPRFLKTNGELLIGGFMQKDLYPINSILASNFLVIKRSYIKDEWIALLVKKDDAI